MQHARYMLGVRILNTHTCETYVFREWCTILHYAIPFFLQLQTAPRFVLDEK